MGDDRRSLNIAIVGGGPGCKAVLEMFEKEKFRQLKANVTGVADINENAIGYQYAGKKGVWTTTDYRDFYKMDSLDLIIELTGNDEVLADIMATKPSNLKVIDHMGARLFWDMIQVEEEKLKAQKALEETKNFLETIINAIQDPITVIDDGFNIIDVNKAFLNASHYSREEVVGQKCFKISHGTDTPCEEPKHTCPYVETSRTGRFSATVHEHIGKHGQKSYHDVRTHPIKDRNGRVTQVVEISTDITKRRKSEEQLKQYAERLKRSLEERSILIDEIHHRVKNNLQTISELLYLQKEFTGPISAKEALSDSIARIKSMALIHHMLTREKGGIVNLKNLLDEIAKLSYKQNIKSNQKIKVKVESIDQPFNSRQAMAISLIFNELISNSFKHGFQNRREGEILIKASKLNGGLSIIIRDNGCGLPAEFDIVKNKNLGLEIVENLVTVDLSGQLSTCSRNGTTFEIRFPVEQS